MAVKPLLQALLVQVMPDEPDAPPEHEEPVEASVRNEVVRLVLREGAAVAEQVHEAHRDAPVDVQDEVAPLPGGDLLDPQRELQNFVAGEVLHGELLDDDHAHVGVVERLYPVANPHDELVLFPHLLREAQRVQPLVHCGRHHPRGLVESAAKSWPDGEKARAKSRDQVFPCSRSHDGVVCTAHRGSMVRSHHENHLDKLTRVRWQFTPEPQKGQHTADPELLLEDLRYANAAVFDLLPSIIANR
mmetsp:Transcript_39488/g.53634  ORF Transcript_39488/g.53634 Transcript_39488/m.53634 type:complete len:245 (-) Transcript_39488:1088-1822(-)